MKKDDRSHPERDHELGDALRTALGDPESHDAFAATVLAAYSAPQWQVRDALASWSRWGVVAAAGIVVAALLAVGPSGEASASLDEALTAESQDEMATFLSDDASPGAGILFVTDGR